MRKRRKMNHSTGKNALKRQKAEAYFQMKIAQLNAGEALPPIRQMIAESGIGRNVLENCIARLAALKILCQKDRSLHMNTTAIRAGIALISRS